MKDKFLNWWFEKRNLTAQLKKEKELGDICQESLKKCRNKVADANRAIIQAAELVNEKKIEIISLKGEVSRLKLKNIFLENKTQ